MAGTCTVTPGTKAPHIYDIAKRSLREDLRWRGGYLYSCAFESQSERRLPITQIVSVRQQYFVHTTVIKNTYT